MAAPLDQGLSGGRSGGDGFRVVTTSGIYLAVLYTHVECQTPVGACDCLMKVNGEENMTQQKNSEFEREPNVRLSPRYVEAVAYASGLHAGQTRKGTAIPYVSHLLGVSSLVLEALGDEDQAIAALLHDAAEDCGGENRLVEIEEMFGPRVASIVRGCSDSLVEDPKVKLPWRQRKEEYIAHLQEASGDVILVSCADKLHNARSLWTDIQRDGVGTMDRFNAPGAEIAWYYSSLLAAFELRGAPADLVIPLREVTENLSQALNDL